MPRRLSPLAATIVLAFSAAAPAPASFEDAIALLEPGVVLVQVEVDDLEDGKGVSAGTGFIMDAEGHVVTNEHIIANNIGPPTVMVHNRESYRATIVLRDPDHDIAFLKIDAPDLQPVPLGDSDAVRNGAAIGVAGYPLAEDLQDEGFELTASFNEGRINAIRAGRTDLTGDRATFFEFDARVNAGNSGGPLFLSDTGEVIGVVVAKLAPHTGISFAIPINAVLESWRNPQFRSQEREPAATNGVMKEDGVYRDEAAGFELRVPEGFKTIAPRDGLSAQFEATEGHCTLFVASRFAAQPIGRSAEVMESSLGLTCTDTRVAELAGQRGLERRYNKGKLAGRARLCVATGRFYALGYLVPAEEVRAWEGAFDEALDSFKLLDGEALGEGPQDYVNEECCFRVRAPKGWTIACPDEPDVRVGVIGPDGRCTVAFRAERLTEKMPAEAYADLVRANFAGTLTAEEGARLGGRRAVERVYRSTDPGGQWRLRVIAATRGSMGYLAVACARERDYDRHSEEINAVIKGFEILPEEGAPAEGPPPFAISRVVIASSPRARDEAAVFASDAPEVHCIFDYVGAEPSTHVSVRWYFKRKCRRSLSANLLLTPGDGQAAFILKRAEDERFPVGPWRADILHRGEVVGSATFRVR